MLMSKRATISVLIPCAATHLPFLPELVSRLSRQTVLPDEVIISVSGTTAMPRLAATSFVVRVVCNAKPAFAGENRNRAVRASTGSVLVYNDADDLPHCQRIEIIKTIFDRGNVDHLIHGFLHLRQKKSFETWDRSRFPSADCLRRLTFKDYVFDHTHHNGNIATSRRVSECVAWESTPRRGEDVHYNKQVKQKFPSRMAMLDDPLIAYRQYLSSFSKSDS